MPAKVPPNQMIDPSKTPRDSLNGVMTMFLIRADPRQALATLTLPADCQIAIVSSKPESVRKLKQEIGYRAERVVEVLERRAGSSKDSKSKLAVDNTAFEPDARSRALLKGIQIAQEDLRDAGGTYDLHEVRTMMRGVSRQAVNKRVKEGSLIAVPGQGNHRCYPTVQFMQDGTIVPGLKAVREALQTTNPWMVLNFLIHPDDRLSAQKPIDLLKAGKVSSVIEAAKRHGEQRA